MSGRLTVLTVPATEHGASARQTVQPQGDDRDRVQRQDPLFGAFAVYDNDRRLTVKQDRLAVVGQFETKIF